MASDDNVIQSENIPNEDNLFMRIHINLLMKPIEKLVQNSEVPPNIFRPHGKSISTDWENYSTPEDTQKRTNDPDKNWVIQMNVGNIRNINPLEVKHTPKIDNKAHTDVLNLQTKSNNKAKLLKMRVLLSDISAWVIPHIT